MPHRHHDFTKPLRPQPKYPEPPGQPLPKGKFGGLAGTVDHVTLTARGHTAPDDNHVFIWVYVGSGPFGGYYECAFNTESADTGKPAVQYCVYEEPVELTDIPSEGFWDAKLSYKALGLHQKDFTTIENGSLRTIVYHYAETSDMVAVYGHTYDHDGQGVHDVHMNSGEAAGSKHPNEPSHDGAIAFYFRHQGEAPRRVWIFIKFQSQTLP